MWLKIDDKMGSHRKVVGLSDAALGLWLRCAVWSAAHESDGAVPDGVIRDLSPDNRSARWRARQSLIRVGLWQECEGGIVIHDWLDYQPSAAELAAHRRADAERKRNRRRGGGEINGQEPW